MWVIHRRSDTIENQLANVHLELFYKFDIRYLYFNFLIFSIVCSLFYDIKNKFIKINAWVI